MMPLRLSRIMSGVSQALGAAVLVAFAVPVQSAEPAPAAAPAAAAERPEARLAAADAVLDRISLDSTAITGNRELPKVMSIVPWKTAEPPAGPDRPMGSLIEELLAPVDRDEFRREITYYHGLTSQSTTRDGQAAAEAAASGAPDHQRSTSSSPPGASSQ
jgi:hypothetical protein